MRILRTDTEKIVNYKTGEVTEKITSQVFTKKLPRFQMMDTENNWHRDLSSTEFHVLTDMAIYESPKTYKVHMDKETRNTIAKNLKLSDITVKQTLAKLVKTPYLKRSSQGVYMINPECIWTGSQKIKEQKLEMFRNI